MKTTENKFVDLQKNDFGCIRVTKETFKGHELVDIRKYFRADDDFKPTTKGIALHPEILPELIKTLKQMAIEYDVCLEDVEN